MLKLGENDEGPSEPNKETWLAASEQEPGWMAAAAAPDLGWLTSCC